VDDDWEYSDNSCPKCGASMAWRRCNQCEDGYWEDDDGINGSELVRCDNCRGRGHEEWCRECGWDNVYKEFLSPEYERAFHEKQSSESQ
jgi:predicted RNA-binding Zn-ribbon protein involved in translation (DUF1610 family)